MRTTTLTLVAKDSGRVHGLEARPSFSQRGVSAAALCLAVFSTLISSCVTKRVEVDIRPPHPSSLLEEARNLTRTDGLVAARNHIAESLRQRDSSSGEMERRLAAATADPDLVFPDSWAALDDASRDRVAMVIIPGTTVKLHGKPPPTREALAEAARTANEMGFRAVFVETPYHACPDENGTLLADIVNEAFASHDRVVLTMLSKGAHDVARYLQVHAAGLPESEREKLVGVISLVGTLQGSISARWFVRSRHPVPGAIRAYLRMTGDAATVHMLATIAADPWDDCFPERMPDIFPNLTWISFVMLPDGPDGRTTEEVWNRHIRRLAERGSKEFSPEDGLVEAAAAILPHCSRVPEIIVRGYGSHALSNGRYPDGTPIAPRTADPDKEPTIPESGGEIIDAFLRAAPAEILRLE